MEGERLYPGQYLLSNNTCFKFALNISGDLFILKRSANVVIYNMEPVNSQFTTVLTDLFTIGLAFWVYFGKVQYSEELIGLCWAEAITYLHFKLHS